MSYISRPKQPLGWGSPFLAIFWLSTKCRPTIDRAWTNYWPIHRWSVGEVSMDEKLYRPRHIWNDYRPCLDRVSTDYRPTVEWVSTECRPTINRVSTDYWPSVDRFIDRYIDRYLGRHYPQYTRSGILISAKIASLQLGCEVLRSDLILNSNLSNKWRPPPPRCFVYPMI